MSFRKYNEGRQEDEASRLQQFIDQRHPTSPDPVEMVRQYEEDENLARILQEYHAFDYVEQDHYLEESARVARQLQAEFDNERVEVLSPTLSIGSRGQNETMELTTSEDDVHDTETGEESFIALESRGVVQESEEEQEEIEDAEEVEDELEDDEDELVDDEDELEDDDVDDEEDEIDEDDGVESDEEEVEHDEGGEESFDDEVDVDVFNRSRLFPVEIDRLPTRIHSAAPSCSSESEAKTCQICQESYASGDELRILPCFHEFHTLCINPWLLKSTTCPVCRVKVDLTERVIC